jgi:hypothetical protein
LEQPAKAIRVLDRDDGRVPRRQRHVGLRDVVLPSDVAHEHGLLAIREREQVVLPVDANQRPLVR